MKLILGIKKIHSIRSLFLISTLILIDQLSKYVIRNFTEMYIINTGISFGLFSQNPFIFFIISIPFIFLIYWALCIKGFNIIIIFIIAGGISNLVDRIFLGGVVDYIKFFNFFWFNLADLFINLGLIVGIISYVFKNKLH